MNKKFYITTSIAYTNAKPHIGFALELVQADILARHYQQKGYDMFFLTGTDDHGIKIQESAQKEKINPKTFVEKNIKLFKNLVENINISNDDFISTSDEKKHQQGAIYLWKKLVKNNDIYKKTYQGLYCVGCEAFVNKRDLIEGKCPHHQKKPELVSEENYFFRLSKYKETIKELVKNNKYKIIPIARKNEVLNIIDEMEDISFSRPVEKLSWGISVPNDKSQTMYVWCDALANYISALGYGTKKTNKFKKYWPADIHVIGKDILKFHAIYWPAMLLSAGLEIPKKLFVHGHITSEGKKMSKSLGNVVDPMEVIKKYGTDALRYYLLREIPSTADGDFSWKRFDEIYNGELANELGNLVNRAIKMINKNNLSMKKFYKAKSIYESYPEFSKEIENFNFNFVLENIWQRVRSANRIIELKKPWKMKEKKQIIDLFEKIFFQIQIIALSLEPFMPETAEKIKKQLKTLKAEPLFPRIS